MRGPTLISVPAISTFWPKSNTTIHWVPAPGVNPPSPTPKSVKQPVAGVTRGSKEVEVKLLKELGEVRSVCVVCVCVCV